MKSSKSSPLSSIQLPFISLSGDSAEVLLHCSQSERIRSVALGATLLIPTLIGGAGAFITVSMLWPQRPEAAATIAAVWALFVLILDRSLLVSRQKKGDWLWVGLRLAITSLGSITFAHAIVALIFSAEIDAGLAKQSELQYATKIEAYDLRIENLRQQLLGDFDVIDAQLEECREERITIDARLAEAVKELAQWQAERDKEIQGLRSAGAGDGHNAQTNSQ